MSSAGVNSAINSGKKALTDPGETINYPIDHLSGRGNIFSENDPNNRKKPNDALGAVNDLGIAARVDSQFALRDESMSRAAQAAGATRSENDADLLGFTPTAKRRSASRTLLG